MKGRWHKSSSAGYNGCFKGQMTDSVFQKIDENNTKVINVPANLAYLYQPLDNQGH